MVHQTISGLSGNSALAPMAMRAMAQFGELSVPALRSLAILPRDTQYMIDRTVVDVGLQRLSFVADLMAEGLVYNLPDPLGTMFIEWETVGKTGGAQRTMTPSARGENQLPLRTYNRLPVYLTTDDFSLGIRTLKNSQRVGVPLDTTLIAQATRRVNEGLEDAAINGATTADGQALSVGGYTAPGLLNAPNANTHTILTSWTDAAATTAGTIGSKIFQDVETMIGKLQADFKFGPYNLYVGTAFNNALDGDFKANGSLTIRQRLEQINAGGRPLRIRVTDAMPATQVALVQMTNDVAELVIGQAPTTIPWMSLDQFTYYWLVMAIMIPRFRSDYDGNSGIVIGSV